MDITLLQHNRDGTLKKHTGWAHKQAAENVRERAGCNTCDKERVGGVCSLIEKIVDQ
jgi:hypothetical protein